MPRPPETFPDIDLSAAGIIIADSAEPEVLAAGWNSSAWKVGSQVVKVTSKAGSLLDTDTLLMSMRAEHYVLADYLDEYMPRTDYFTVPQHSGDQAHVVTVQPFIEGTRLYDFLGNPSSETEPLQEFLAKSKEVFKAERLMPDVACLEHGFNVFRNNNILIQEDEEARPVLVDTTFGKTQRSKTLGPIWTRAIYSGAVVAHKRLKLETPRR